jgi:hypothetical protein
MGWIAALVMIPALIMLGMLWRPEGDKAWRNQAEGLRATGARRTSALLMRGCSRPLAGRRRVHPENGRGPGVYRRSCSFNI